MNFERGASVNAFPSLAQTGIQRNAWNKKGLTETVVLYMVYYRNVGDHARLYSIISTYSSCFSVTVHLGELGLIWQF